MMKNGTKRGKKKQVWAKSRSGTGTKTGWYRYQNRVVPVPPNRTQSVPVPIQVVQVPPYRMCMVPVPNRVVPVPQCPKCLDSYNFV